MNQPLIFKFTSQISCLKSPSDCLLKWRRNPTSPRDIKDLLDLTDTYLSNHISPLCLFSLCSNHTSRLCSTQKVFPLRTFALCSFCLKLHSWYCCLQLSSQILSFPWPRSSSPSPCNAVLLYLFHSTHLTCSFFVFFSFLPLPEIVFYLVCLSVMILATDSTFTMCQVLPKHLPYIPVR